MPESQNDKLGLANAILNVIPDTAVGQATNAGHSGVGDPDADAAPLEQQPESTR
jgi:hypothetical protein